MSIEVELQDALIDIAKSFKRAQETKGKQWCTLNQISRSNKFIKSKFNSQMQEKTVDKFKVAVYKFLQEIGISTFQVKMENIQDALNDLNNYIQNFFRIIYLLKRCNLQLDSYIQSLPYTKRTSVCKICIEFFRVYILENQDRFYFSIISQSLQHSDKLRSQENTQFGFLIEFLKTVDEKQIELQYNVNSHLYELRVVERAVQNQCVYKVFIQFFGKEVQKQALQQQKNLVQIFKDKNNNLIIYLQECQNVINLFIGNIRGHLNQNETQQIQNDIQIILYQNLDVVQKGLENFFETNDESYRNLLNEFYKTIKLDKDLYKLLKDEFHIYIIKYHQRLCETKYAEIEKAKQQRQKDIPKPFQIFYDIYTELLEKTDYVVNIVDKDLEISKLQVNTLERLLNNDNQSIEFLTRYCDYIMKKKNDEQSFKQISENIKRLFALLHSKDAFIQFYKKQLKSRLIYQQSTSQSDELELIRKLRVVDGAYDMQELQVMLQELNLSSDFLNRLGDIQNQFKYKCDCLILEQRIWCFKISNNQALNIPPQMYETIKIYEKKYIELHNDRQLDWLYTEGQGEISLNFILNKSSYNLLLQTMQIIIFWHFNQKKQWEVKDLLETVKCNKLDLEIALNPLIKAKILLRQEKDLTEYKDQEILTLNYYFSSNRRRQQYYPTAETKPLKLEQLEKEKNLENEQLDKERENVVECMIVRIMKARQGKELSHQELIKQCTDNIRQFIPHPQFIKRRIECLIWRGYLKRKEDCYDTYEYLN